MPCVVAVGSPNWDTGAAQSPFDEVRHEVPAGSDLFSGVCSVASRFGHYKTLRMSH